MTREVEPQRRLCLDKFSQTMSNFKRYWARYYNWKMFTKFYQVWPILTNFNYLYLKTWLPGRKYSCANVNIFLTPFILSRGSPSSKLAHDDHMPQLTSKFHRYQNYSYVETNISQISIKSNGRSSRLVVEQ